MKETVKSRFSDKAYANGMYGISNFSPPAQYSRAEYLQLSWPVARIQLAFSIKTVAHDSNTFPNGAVWCATTNSISSPRFQPPIPHGISTYKSSHPLPTPSLPPPPHLLTSHSPHKKHSLLPPLTHTFAMRSFSVLLFTLTAAVLAHDGHEHSSSVVNIAVPGYGEESTTSTAVLTETKSVPTTTVATSTEVPVAPSSVISLTVPIVTAPIATGTGVPSTSTNGTFTKPTLSSTKETSTSTKTTGGDDDESPSSTGSDPAPTESDSGAGRLAAFGGVFVAGAVAVFAGL